MSRKMHRSKDVKEFDVGSEKRRPAASLSSNSELRPMDEISLLKKGLLTKAGSHSLRSGKPYQEAARPISLQELTSRGLVLDDGKVIYGLPGQGLQPSKQLEPAISTATSSTSETATCQAASTIGSMLSRQTLVEPAVRQTVYRVGLDEEQATLVMADTRHGKRYELNVGKDFQLLLFDAEKTSSLTVLKYP